MTDSNGRIALQEEQRHRLADDLGSADDDRVLAGDRLACAIEQFDDARRGAGLEDRPPLHEQADVVRMKPVDVLGGIDGVEHLLGPVFSDGGRKRRLNQDAVALRIGVERSHGCQELGNGRGRREPVDCYAKAGVSPGAFLVTDVDMRRGIVADEHDVQRRRPASQALKRGDTRGHLRTNRVGDPRAVEQQSALPLVTQFAVVLAVGEVQDQADREPAQQPEPVRPAEPVDHRAANQDAENRHNR